jgi:hypothetical protein
LTAQPLHCAAAAAFSIPGRGDGCLQRGILLPAAMSDPRHAGNIGCKALYASISGGAYRMLTKHDCTNGYEPDLLISR